MSGKRLTSLLPWSQADGTPISCTEKLRVLEENHAELAQVLRDTFEDAVLMGVEAEAMRAILADLVAGLKTPLKETK